jgi:ornithine cyclodeaminase/alanine dehydrogenase-like protein (mu-crystallin family)
MLVLSERDVERLLPMDACIEVMTEALSALARGEMFQPLRSIAQPPGENSFMGLMPAHRGGDRPAWGLKAICLFPDNPKRGLDAHQGGVLLFDGGTGQLLAVMNASAITAIRTAAVSGVATRLLARPGARIVGIIGAGVQGRSHVDAMRAVLHDPEIRIFSPNAEHARTLAGDVGATAVASAEEAVRGADVVVTATSSRQPVFSRDWLAPGAHVNAVGMQRELDARTVADSAFFVDRRESTEKESPFFLEAVGPDHIRAEIGELLVGSGEGRRSDEELAVFNSLGIAVEDLATADWLYRRARDEGVGAEVEF